MVTSGVRIGATAMTIKGMKEKEMEIIAGIIDEVANNIENYEVLDEIRNRVQNLGAKFPLQYPEYYEAE
jgi:glycine hydroxymethyltransferase